MRERCVWMKVVGRTRAGQGVRARRQLTCYDKAYSNGLPANLAPVLADLTLSASESNDEERDDRDEQWAERKQAADGRRWDDPFSLARVRKGRRRPSTETYRYPAVAQITQNPSVPAASHSDRVGNGSHAQPDMPGGCVWLAGTDGVFSQARRGFVGFLKRDGGCSSL